MGIGRERERADTCKGVLRGPAFGGQPHPRCFGDLFSGRQKEDELSLWSPQRRRLRCAELGTCCQVNTAPRHRHPSAPANPWCIPTATSTKGQMPSAGVRGGLLMQDAGGARLPGTPTPGPPPQGCCSSRGGELAVTWILAARLASRRWGNPWPPCRSGSVPDSRSLWEPQAAGRQNCRSRRGRPSSAPPESPQSPLCTEGAGGALAAPCSRSWVGGGTLSCTWLGVLSRPWPPVERTLPAGPALSAVLGLLWEDVRGDGCGCLIPPWVSSCQLPLLPLFLSLFPFTVNTYTTPFNKSRGPSGLSGRAAALRPFPRLAAQSRRLPPASRCHSALP